MGNLICKRVKRDNFYIALGLIVGAVVLMLIIENLCF